LVTAFDQPALGAVYKLSALKNHKNQWEYKLKLSEQAIKVNNPGIQQVRRFYNNQNKYLADMIYDTQLPLGNKHTIIDPIDPTRRKYIDSTKTSHKDLLVPVFKKGKPVYQLPEISAIREFVQQEMGKMHKGLKRFVNPHSYAVGLEKKLYDLRTKLVLELRKIK
ncbi:MAG: nicotinate phosphoribosyltransferase, partial [Bacteroidetes bacterium]|nr:nicotinate phosphoribosyltransferase [Bacteroidota bacterium]